MTTETHSSGDISGRAEPTRDFCMSFTSTPRGARLARSLVSHRLDTWGYPYESETNVTVTLIVAERTSNAVTHGRVPGRDFRLCLSLNPAAELVRAEVADARDDRMPSVPPLAPPDPGAESGRGLCLVSAPTSRWAVVPREGGGPGKTVRAEADV